MSFEIRPMKVYLLYYDNDDTGAREERNVFYTPCEVYLSPEDRQKRIDFIKTKTNFKGSVYTEDKEVNDGNINADVER
jgi:hypothetical protein